MSLIKNIKRPIWSIILIAPFFLFSQEKNLEQNNQATTDSIQVFRNRLVYGFDLGCHKITKCRIKRGESIASILKNLGTSPKTTHHITQKNKNHTIRIGEIKANDTYLIVRDTVGNLNGLIYYRDPLNYLKIDFRHGIQVSQQTHKVKFREREAFLKIRSSLYETILNQKLDLVLVNILSEIFAWKIDFFKLHPGDTFKIIFEESYIQDSIYVGIQKIKAIEANNKGENFFAFHYRDNNIEGYYDEMGNSLQGQFLKAPLKYNRITSRYKRKRYHPILKKWKAHKGVDYGAPKGTLVRATADGTVTHSQYRSYNGQYVKIKHNNIYSTQYLHLSKRLVRKGQKVKQGQAIGKVGMSGLATGAHLCYRFWKNGRQVDPYKQNFQAIKKLKGQDKRLFRMQVLYLKTRLNHM